jgi:hypothetical protein
MSMTKLNKIEGAKEQCPGCTQTIFCRMTKGSDKYPAKLQWQNEDGTAHYSFDFKTKETSCKNQTQGKTEPLVITMPKGTGTDGKVLERFASDSETIAKQKIAKYIGVKKACDESGIINPVMIGMIFNAVDKEEL